METQIKAISLALLSCLLLLSSIAYAGNPNCAADASWFSNPSMPQEVKKSNPDGSSNFCDFYQFSWQAFAYLMAPSTNDKNMRNFEDASQYPELQVDAQGRTVNSCDGKNTGGKLFVRSVKTGEAGEPFLIPERIGQAGGGATIYDQLGNVVYYDVKFDRGTCDVERVKELANFPGGTTELKTAWKVLDGKDKASDFITMQAVIGSDTKPTTLAMVGFHIAVATPDHPEFVWATFEHKVNVPVCAAADTKVAWSFASPACTKALANGDHSAIINCDFNKPKKHSSVTGAPTEICRDFPYGSKQGDPNYEENVGDISTLNENVQPYLKGDAFSVLTNYFNLGALWLSDPTQDSSLSNQRGSLRLANSVAETDFINVDLKSGFVSNCFGCHNYNGTANPSKGKNTTSGALSHIFDDIAIGVGQCLDVQTKSVVNDQQGADNLCPKTCAGSSSQLKWNGQWTNQSALSGAQLPITVCGCCGAEL